MGQFIDFKWIVANADVEAVLTGLEIPVARQSGAEIRVSCPFHQPDNNPSCSINTENRMWMCHAGCGDGDILDFSAQVLDLLGDKRQVASKIAGWSNIAVANPAGRNTNARKKPSGKSKKPALKPAPVKADDDKATPAEWKPFTTRLKLDGEHEFGQDRFTPEMVNVFNMGFQDRGYLKDRWCVPLHDENGDQLGYTGRHIAKGEPRWLFPPEFPKSSMLFNLHRLRDDDGSAGDGTVVIVEGIGDAIRLYALGIPVVATLGTHVSEAHVDLLEAVGFVQAVLMFDGDDEGQKAVPSALASLSSKLFVRSCTLPDEHDPETVPLEFLTEHLWWL